MSLERERAARQGVEQRLTRALEQQTATSEILRVISSSPSDLSYVGATILASATRLCEAELGNLFVYDGDAFWAVAHHNASQPFRDVLSSALRPGPETGVEGLLANPVPFQIADIRATEAYRDSEPYAVVGADLEGIRTLLAVPFARDGRLIGVITIYRREIRPFTPAQIELVTAFADQAVIAIENVRLFNELQARNRELIQALEQQTATSEILRVISASPTDAQPVFDAIAQSVVRLCDAFFGVVFRFDGTLIHMVAHHNFTPEGLAAFQEIWPSPPGESSMTARAILHRVPIQMADAQSEGDVPADTRRAARGLGFRAGAAIPMLREGWPVGAIAVARDEARPFSDGEIALLQTFADQAVIAIENVRLFNELQARNRELNAALEQQTATSELLKVIGRATFDVQPVFETLAENAVRLCAAERVLIYRLDGRELRVVATHNASPVLKAFLPRNPLALARTSAAGRASLERRSIHIHDVLADPEYTYGATPVDPVRTVLAVPMLRPDELLGVIVIYRHEVKPFTDSQIALMETFADQASIAIENVRLFTELQARTADLSRSVGQLTALGDVGRTLSSTLDLDAVLQTIVTRASQLAGTDACSVFEYDEATEAFHLRATHNLDDAVVALARRAPIRKGEGVQGRMAVTRQPVQMPDISAEDAYRGPLRDVLLRTGTRAVLAIPMLREDQLIGGLTVNKKTPGPFSSEVIELLKTFATQSALAIQNARLFREIADKSRQLEVASQHKSEFLANMSHELRTPLNAIIGFSEVLTERMFGDLNEKQEEYLKDIHASGQHLLSLINDILDLSKIEAGRMELELSDFDLPTALANALTLIRDRAERRGIVLDLSVDKRLGRMRADERKVRQVVLNLLSNAIKFTPEGGRIEVRAEPRDGSVDVSVSDTGVGIAPEDQEAVFEEFRQVGTAAKKVEGTGLGLALSRKLVELHGGRIWVRSEVGQGTTFSFTIPARPLT